MNVPSAARPSMRSHSDVNYFFFLLAGKTLRVLRRFRQGRVFVARRSEPLTGSAQYTTHLAQQKEKQPLQPSLVDFARQPSIRTQKWTMRSGALCHTGECCYLDFGLQEGSFSP